MIRLTYLWIITAVITNAFLFYGAKKTLILFNPYSQNEISYMFDLCSEWIHPLDKLSNHIFTSIYDVYHLCYNLFFDITPRILTLRDVIITLCSVRRLIDVECKSKKKNSVEMCWVKNVKHLMLFYLFVMNSLKFVRK